MSANGLSVQHTQDQASVDSAQCKELSAYSRKCKPLTKPVLLADDNLCILH